jgi:hypothetical protein
MLGTVKKIVRKWRVDNYYCHFALRIVEQGIDDLKSKNYPMGGKKRSEKKR